MKFALLVLITAATLQGVTVLPESSAEWTLNGGSSFGILGDDGSSIGGSMPGHLSPFYGPVDDPFLYPDFDAGGSDMDTRINGQWVPSEFGGAGVRFWGPGIAVTEDDILSGPFSFYGEAASREIPLIEFFGQGTVYFTLVRYNFPVEGLRIEIESVRYEFEAIPTPEPATWGMLLLGLGAACWAGNKRC